MENRKTLKKPVKMPKGLPVGKAEDDMSSSERVSRNKSKPGPAVPGKSTGPFGSRG